MNPARDGARKACEVGGERRIILGVIGRVIADDIDERGLRAPRIVQVGETIGEARPEMEERRSGLFGDAAIAVRHAGHRAFEQAEDRSHTVHLVEGGDEMHLRGAGVRETDFHTGIHQRAHKAFRTVHFPISLILFCRLTQLRTKIR